MTREVTQGRSVSVERVVVSRNFDPLLSLR